MVRQRDIWIDNVKVVACILVVLGHFYQSMVQAGLTNAGNIYNWFNSTIYMFHVPLFFICSGYLYQKYSSVTSLEQWRNNVLRKLVSLGMPYFFFSFLTWGLKKIFSSSVNIQYGGLGEVLFFEPASPYWYLYVLFFIFLITVTIVTFKHQMIILLVSLLLKILQIIGINTGIYAIDKVMVNWIWFILGMLLVERLSLLSNLVLGYVLLALLMICSIAANVGVLHFKGIEFVLGLLACYSIVSVIFSSFKDKMQNPFWGFLSKYTMPIFLMHTLFAAPVRVLLLKCGMKEILIHCIVGIIIGFVGPIVAMVALEKIKPLDFLVYPLRYIKIAK